MPLTGSGSFPAIALPISTYLSGVAVVFNHLDGRFPEVGRSNPAFHIGLIGHYHLSSSCLLLPDLETCWLDFLFKRGMDTPTFQKLYMIKIWKQPWRKFKWIGWCRDSVKKISKRTTNIAMHGCGDFHIVIDPLWWAKFKENNKGQSW